MPQTNSGMADLRVVVTTALGAVPIEGASVTVSTEADQNGARTLLYSVRTNSSGVTPPLALATPPRANSMTPDGGTPFSVYTVEVAHECFNPVTALRVTMFEGVPAVLPVTMVPLAENQPTGETDLTATGEPQALYLGRYPGEE